MNPATDQLATTAVATRPTGPVAIALAAMLQDPDWMSLPHGERTRVRQLHRAFLEVHKPGITRQLQTIARGFNRGFATIRRNYSDWTEAGRDWRVLIDGRKTASQGGNFPADFPDYFQKLCERYQRCTASAIRRLHRDWDNRTGTIPGYEDFPGWPKRPASWSKRNLYRIAPTDAELTERRRGSKAAKKYRPQHFRTRVGLWPGSHIQCDDVWHDNYVRWNNDVTRVLEFGALDVFSACRFAWGTKPRMPKTDGAKGFHDLTAREFRFFLAGLLWSHGYNAERGTTLILEHAKTTLPDSVIGLLSDYAGIQVTKGGITGEQQAILGLWGGRAGGESNTKSHLESLHNLIHNELSAIPGQTGKDRQHSPEETHGIVTYQQAALDWLREMPADIRGEFQHPLLDYQTQFLPLLDYLYKVAINGRQDHRLEGWTKLGHIVTEYTLDPANQTNWLALEEIPQATRSLLMTAVKEAPADWSRRRALSPGEVWDAGRHQLTRGNPALIWDIIGHDEARERKVHGAYFRFHDADIDDEELIYEARVTRPDGSEEELPSGETFAVMAMPYAPEILVVGDARGRCLGVARRVHRTSIADEAGTIQSWARNAQRKAERLQPLRDRWQPEEDAAQDLRRHNAELGFTGTGSQRPRRDSGQREARQVAERRQADQHRTDQRATERALQRVQATEPAPFDPTGDGTPPDARDLLTDDSACPFD